MSLLRAEAGIYLYRTGPRRRHVGEKDLSVVHRGWPGGGEIRSGVHGRGRNRRGRTRCRDAGESRASHTWLRGVAARTLAFMLQRCGGIPWPDGLRRVEKVWTRSRRRGERTLRPRRQPMAGVLPVPRTRRSPDRFRLPMPALLRSQGVYGVRINRGK